MKNRYELQNALKALTHGYWGMRALAQLAYLEELNLCHAGKYDALLNACSDALWQAQQSEGAITRAAVDALEKALAAASGDAKAITVDCAAHAHIDMNWMWRFDETVSITIDTFRTMLNLMNEYPAFTFSQSQASVYRIIEQYAPEMLPEIRARIAEGRWEVTASTWVETDKNMPNGESLTRHLLYTRRYLKQMLGLNDGQFLLDFEPDTFGHNANVPEILQSGGVRYLYHCRGYDEHNLYRFRSPSGAEVIAFRDPTWYNDTITYETFLYIPEFCHRHGINRMAHLYGVGDHGGGATRRDIERILDMNTWPCMPTLGFGRMVDFFRYLETLTLPVVDHELNFIFSGCYTTQTRIKKANRAAEAALHESEAFNSFSHIAGGYPYAANAYFGAWENVLFNHFHDIIPGSGTTDTREYAMGIFQQTMARAGTRKAAALRGISSRIDTASLLPEAAAPCDSIAEGAGVGHGVSAFGYTDSSHHAGKRRLFHVFNPSQISLLRNAVITVWDWEGSMSKIGIDDEAGKPVPFELMDSEPQHYWGHNFFRLTVLCDVPSYGYRTLLLSERAEKSKLPIVADPRKDTPCSLTLENAYVRASFDVRTMALVSYTDKRDGREFVCACEGGAGFRYIEEDDGRGMAAWTIGRYMKNVPVEGHTRLTRGVSGELNQSFRYTTTVGGSRLEVTVSLASESRTLRYDVKAEWRELGTEGNYIPQLAFAVPLGYECPRYTYDIPCGLIAREAIDDDVPAGSFCFAPAQQGGLMLLSDSKYGFRAHADTVSLTLIRSAYAPDSVPECYDHEISFGISLLENAAPETLAANTLAFRHPLIAVAAGSHAGELPLSGSFLRVTGGDVAFSSIKMSEDDADAMVIRLYDLLGKPQTVTLELQKAPKAAVLVDAHEQALGADAAVCGKNVTLELGAHHVAAVKVTF